MSFEQDINTTPGLPDRPLIRKNSLDETIDEFLFEEEDYVETAVQYEYDDDEEDDIRVKEKEDFSDSSGHSRPPTPKNSGFLLQETDESEEKVSDFVYDYYENTTTTADDEAKEEVLKKKLGLRASRSMPQIHKDLISSGINL